MHKVPEMCFFLILRRINICNLQYRKLWIPFNYKEHSKYDAQFEILKIKLILKMFDLFHLISSTKIYDNELDEDQDIFLYMCISKWLINLNSFKIVSIYNNQNVDFKVSILRILSILALTWNLKPFFYIQMKTDLWY